MNIYMSGQGAFAVQVAEALLDEGHKIVGAAAPGSARGSPTRATRCPGTGCAPGRTTGTSRGRIRRNCGRCTSRTGWTSSSPRTRTPSSAAWTRARASVATIGYHPSLLPLHRGRDAIRWTVRDGDKVTGGSVYHLTERTDGGPLAAQEHLLVPPGSTPQTLWRDHLAPLGVRLLLKVVADLTANRRIEVPQDERLATWEPAMDAPPLFKPELIALPGTDTVRVESGRWALHDR